MRSFIIIPFFAILIFLSAFSEKKSTAKKSGVYNRDSVLNVMPGYQKGMESGADIARQVDSIHATMYFELSARIAQFNKDSLQYSPLIRELKRREFIDMATRIDEFSQQAEEEVRIHYQNFIQPFNEKITSAANDLQKKKKFDTILDKTEMIGYHTANPSVKIINVTNELRQKLKTP
jgi:Skp family chaperone for outer membrane proteins